MQLSELLCNLHPVEVTGDTESIEINSITADSREVSGETLFVAVRGFETDGHKFIEKAISAGASAVMVESGAEYDNSLFQTSGTVKILVENSRRAMANISDKFYGHPSQELTLTGITGTKGKTTTGFLLKSVFDHGSSKSGLIGTIGIYIGDKEIGAELTTPESNKINALLDEMITAGCSSCVMEVSSHALKLHRVDFLDFDFAVYTNLASDHLDFHRTLEDYFRSKKKFFDMLKKESVAVVNSDDAKWQELVTDCPAEVITYGTSDDADFRISDVYYDLNGTRFNIKYMDNEYTVKTRLIGEFNAYNAAAAFAVGMLSGIAPQDVILGIEKTRQVPGRFEVVGDADKKIIVDYSHTADSLKQALNAIQILNTERLPVITVFGCGGDRDKTKRPEMGKIASRVSEQVIVTSDNPRTEDPMKIIDDIIDGIESDNYTVIENRHEAIKSAVLDSPEKAVILIAGKGHETYQEINGVRNYFSDKETVMEFLKK